MSTQTLENVKSVKFENVTIEKEPAIKTGNDKFDNWFSKSGGLVRRSVTYLTGTSGGGKTTLMVNLMKWLSTRDIRTSMYSREMRKDDVKEQTMNIKLAHGNAFIADVKTHPTFDDYMTELNILNPSVVVVDSLQVIAQADYPNMSEEQSTVSVLKRLIEWTQNNDASLILIGHVNKDGNYNGVSMLKHLVDGHIELVFDKKRKTRTITWSKNRKGDVGTPLYYTFAKDGIELYSEEEWKAMETGDRNFSDYIAECTNAYIKTLDKNNENYASFKKEYNEGLKNLSKSSDDLNGLYPLIIKLLMELSVKYKF